MAGAAPLNEDFLDMLHALSEAGAEFVVVGAHALSVHGVPRATGDLDIFVRPSPENAVRVLAALRRFGAPVEQHGVTAADLATEGTVYQVGLPPRRIDLLTRLDGVSFEEVWNGRLERELAGVRVAFIGRDEFIRNKTATGRPKDQLDLLALGEAEGDR